MASDLPPLPRSMVEPPPPEMVPKNLAEALVAIGKLQVTCANQESALAELRKVADDHDKIIATANGWRQALLWLGAVTVGVSAVIYNILNAKPGGK